MTALIRQGTLTPEQLIVAEHFALPKKAGKTITQLANEVGVSERQIYRWRSEPAFVSFVRVRTMANAMDHLADVMDQVAESAKSGKSIRAADIYLRAVGVMNDQLTIRPANPEDERTTEAVQADIQRLLAQLEEQEREYNKFKDRGTHDESMELEREV
ncbi:phBC6A51 family helix-turn-helix protein [Paenibacillus sp. OV219]|uniref:phBC6A51 family helix-turn-helix protein n=1 Tax=Paenibacillus sp. OV219 TaxID=1884377 RepID=UPI0008CCB999|nr:phBC6A51 family helix-turn-helix protein [Paenibacillus sp. OV219]SEP17475.1 Helix-turn-helix of insertion element transposase [Paenibacillus sp. OV219]